MEMNKEKPGVSSFLLTALMILIASAPEKGNQFGANWPRFLFVSV